MQHQGFLEADAGGAQLSIEWHGGDAEQGDLGLERAAAFASILARTLGAAGYQARQLSVGVSRAPGGALQLAVRGDVVGINESDFESLARATLNGVGRRLGFGAEGTVYLVTRLESTSGVVTPLKPAPIPAVSVPAPVAPAQPVPPPPAPAPAPATRRPPIRVAVPASLRERDWNLVGRIGVGLALGLLLGVLGLPRLDLGNLFSRSPAPATATNAFPTSASVVDVVSVDPVRTAPTATTAPAVLSPTTIPTAVPSPTRNPVVFAERFVTPLAGWPNDLRGTAWFADGEYRLFAREPGRFVATGVPLSQPLQDARLSAQFHKVGGPLGGGYGLILRDQGNAIDRDSRNEAGQYLVVEIGDRGDVGVWHRDQTRWIDVVPWTHSDAVHLDRDSNALTVTTQGTAMRFEVNGSVVAEMNYDRLPPYGGVGIFVGGDLNEVALEWLRIENL